MNFYRRFKGAILGSVAFVLWEWVVVEFCNQVTR